MVKDTCFREPNETAGSDTESSNRFTSSIHPLALAVAAIWTLCVVLALQCGDLSAAAGRLPERWTGVGMAFGLLNAALVVAGVWVLPASLPRILVRLIQLIG